MSQDNNFVPNQQAYKPLSPFKLFVKSNFPFIEATYEALDNYGLYCKIVEYLNTVIENENIVEDNVQALYNAFNDLNDYVSNYFETLDVQEEINNKLDEMIEDGTINVIIGKYITDLDTQIIELSQRVSNLQNNAVTTDETNVVSMEMLTPEVRSALTGGSTPSIGIASIGAENIKNKAVDVLHLSDSLGASFSNSLTEIDLSNVNNLQGYARGNVGSEISFASDTDYHYKIVNLTKDVIYNYVGNIYLSMNGIVVVNSSNEIIYTTRNTSQASDKFESIIFRPYENGMKAYINYKNAEATSFAKLKALSYISATTPVTYEVPLQKIKELEGAYVRADQSYSSGQIMLSTNTGSQCDVYRMHKGQKYQFTGTNYYLLAAIAITDESYQTQYISSHESQGTAESVSYTFTAQNDGYILCSSLSSNYPYTLQVIPKNENYIKVSNLKDKNLCYTGDSICYGAGYAGGYAKLIQEKTASNMQNIGVGGGTIADGTTYKDSIPRFHICNSISSLSSSADAVIIEGGCNDYWNNVQIGTLTDDFDDEVNKNTFIGALEYMFRACMDRYYDIPVVFVINHNINTINFTQNSIGKTYKDYRNAIYQACEKYGVKVIDIGKDTPFNTYFDDQKNNLTDSGDGVHPNQNGYEAFYVPIIQSTLEMLF